MALILDTHFIITAEREARRGLGNRADRFLASCSDETLFITFTIASELACGQSAAQRFDWERLCRPYPILPATKEVSLKYQEICRGLAAKGRLIGTNDLWIAATALAHGMSVVTNNQEDFERVPGRVVINY